MLILPSSAEKSEKPLRFLPLTSKMINYHLRKQLRIHNNQFKDFPASIKLDLVIQSDLYEYFHLNLNSLYENFDRKSRKSSKFSKPNRYSSHTVLTSKNYIKYSTHLTR